MTTPTRVGLVLGAGGESGASFIRAALTEIESITGWRPSTAQTIIGTSIGALIAARLGPADSTSTGLESADLESATDGLRHLAANIPGPSSRVTDLLTVPSRRLGGRVVALVVPSGRYVADYPIGEPPHHSGASVVSVARPLGSRRVTRLVDAKSPGQELYASAAVPGFSANVLLDGRRHIDGAVHSSTNADLISPDDHDLLVVIAPLVAISGASALARSHRALLMRELAPWRKTKKPTLVLAPSREQYRSRSSLEASAEAALGQLRRASPGVGS